MEVIYFILWRVREARLSRQRFTLSVKQETVNRLGALYLERDYFINEDEIGENVDRLEIVPQRHEDRTLLHDNYT